MFDADAAARIGGAGALVEFAVGDAELTRLRRESVEMFQGLGVLRMQE